MSDQRDLTLGVQFEMTGAVSHISDIMESIQQIKSGFRDAEEEAAGFGTAVAGHMGTAADSLEQMGDAEQKAAGSLKEIANSGKDVKNVYKEMGTSAGSFEEAVIETSAKAMTETNSLTKTIRAGFQGAYGFAEKKVKDFGTRIKSGAAGVKNALLHPLQTIRDKLSDTLEKAQGELDDTGEEAEKAGIKLKDMGTDGGQAGSRIKDAVGSAVKSFFAISAGIELFKAGIDMVKNFATSILSAGMEAEQTGAKFGAMFREDSGVQEWAENFAGAIHRGEKEVQSFLVSNKKMYQELGITGAAADDLSKITTSLAYDFGSAFKMEDAEALGVIQDYIGGNISALSEYGIQIDDTALRQAALAMGLGANIEALDDAAMAQVRMSALLENRGAIQQAAAKKQEGYANGIKSLKGIWSDFLASAGEKFSPVFTELTNTILNSWPQVEPALTGLADLLSNGLASGMPVIAELASSAIPPLIQAIGELFTAAAPLGGAFLELATTALPPLVSAVSPVISTFGTLAQAILPPVSRIIGNIATTVVPPLVSILKTLSENVIAPLMPSIESIANAILPALSAGLGLIPPALQIISPILSGIADILSRVVGFLSKIAEWAAGGLSSLLDKAASFLGAGTSAKSAGVNIPHNADGDNYFKGGWTHINERGGELAFLPSGSAIIPADKSEQIIQGNRSQNMVINAPFQPVLNLTIPGNMDPAKQNVIDPKARQELWELYQEFHQEAAMNMAIQQGNM